MSTIRSSGVLHQRLTGNTRAGLSSSKDLSWEEIGKSAASLAKVRDGLVRARKLKGERERDWHGGIDLYARGVKDLDAAVKVKDRKAVDRAVRHLSQSCAHCHHYYYPGFGD